MGSRTLTREVSELRPSLGPDEAPLQAARCLFCHDAPCTRACPTGIDIPRFIRQILHEDLRGAAATILESNVLGGSCARVCPTEVLCEGACVDRVLGREPVPIARLQRHAMDAEGRAVPLPVGTDSGRTVALVGAGPAGLACLAELRRLGHTAVVIDAREEAGGLLGGSIAPYKIDKTVALAEAGRILNLGAELRFGSTLAATDIEALRNEYDAVFLGLGLGASARLSIPGSECEGVWEGLDFIDRAGRGEMEGQLSGLRAVVIGGGNTAVDSAVACARLGAKKVTLAYRRDRASMPAYRGEIQLARAMDVELLCLAAPLEYIHENGKLRGLRLVEIKMIGEGRSAKLEPLPGSEFTLDCEVAVEALGQVALDDGILGLEGLEKEGRRLSVDPATGATTLPGVFAGGDCVNGGSEVVDAVQAGKIAARGIDAYLRDGGKGGRP